MSLVETEIGTIAPDWKVVPLKDVAEKPQYGLTAKAAKSGDIKFLRITDITDQGVNWSTVPFCSAPKKKIDICRLKSGDIVFARIGATTGKSYMISDPPDAVFASYLIRVRAGEELEPRFLIQFFQSCGYWQQVDANKHANLKKGVNGSILSELLLPLPPLPEQQKIAHILSTVQRAIEPYVTLTGVYQVVWKAYTKKVQVDREFQRKTDLLVREQVGSYGVEQVEDFIEINAETIELIKKWKGGEGTKVINLIKSIEKLAEEGSDDPYLIAMAERARAVQESFESRQTSTAEALEELLRQVDKNEARKKEQAERSFDGLTYFVYRTLMDGEIDNAEAVSRSIRQAFADFPNWKRSENALRELRKKVTFAIFAETEDLDRVTGMVDDLFTLLEKADCI